MFGKNSNINVPLDNLLFGKLDFCFLVGICLLFLVIIRNEQIIIDSFFFSYSSFKNKVAISEMKWNKINFS